jgi:hypothetical protein
MAANSTIPTLPNPFTPLAFLPPALAGQHEAAIYVSVAMLSARTVLPSMLRLYWAHFNLKAFSWDWIMSLPEEIKMCRQREFTPAIIAYFLSR